jgi:hypothetical protein
MTSEIDPHLDWFLRMQDSADYLDISRMEAGMAYAIWARNAFVGIWLPEKQGFLISRYKMHTKPFLFVEYHWDTGEPLGTAKALRPIEFCPLPLPPDASYHDEMQNAPLCAWLDALETRHPPCTGWDSVGERRRAAVKAWIRQTASTRSPDS